MMKNLTAGKILLSFTKTYLWLILLSNILLSSCVAVYIPSALFIPSLEEKGDISLQATIGSSELTTGGAFALSNTMGATLGLQAYYPGGNFTSASYLLEGGMVYFQKNDPSSHYEILAGLGYGKSDYLRSYKTYKGNRREERGSAQYSKIYAQYNLHFPLKPLVFSFASRVSHILVFDYQKGLYAMPQNNEVSFESAVNRHGLFIDPNLIITIDLGMVSLFQQTGFSILVAGNDMLMDHGPFMVNLGMRFKINTQTGR